MIRVKIRITSTSMKDSERAKEYLLTQLPGLSLATARKGGNPKYADSPNVLAYGDLDVPEKVRGETGRLKQEPVKPRRRQASRKEKSIVVKQEPEEQFTEARQRLLQKVEGKNG